MPSLFFFFYMKKLLYSNNGVSFGPFEPSRQDRQLSTILLAVSHGLSFMSLLKFVVFGVRCGAASFFFPLIFAVIAVLVCSFALAM